MNKRNCPSDLSSQTRDLESLRIASPCPKNWADMKGNDQKRFCEHCNLHVHNLSALSPRQIHTLAETPGRRCVAYLEIRTAAFKPVSVSNLFAALSPAVAACSLPFWP